MEQKQINNVIEIHKRIFYEFLTRFAYLDTIISFNISSYFHNEHEKKIELTDLVLCDINSQKQFDIFLRILKKQKFKEDKITELRKKYSSVRNLRNLLAHSYLIPQDNIEFSGKTLKLTRLTNSNGKGYSQNLQIADFETKLKLLEDLIEELYHLNLPYY